MADKPPHSDTKQSPPIHSGDSIIDPAAKNTERVRDMAARLFAELFYRQVMEEEREAKRKKQKDKKIDGDPYKGLQ